MGGNTVVSSLFCKVNLTMYIHDLVKSVIILNLYCHPALTVRVCMFLENCIYTLPPTQLTIVLHNIHGIVQIHCINFGCNIV